MKFFTLRLDEVQRGSLSPLNFKTEVRSGGGSTYIVVAKTRGQLFSRQVVDRNGASSFSYRGALTLACDAYTYLTGESNHPEYDYPVKVPPVTVRSEPAAKPFVAPSTPVRQPAKKPDPLPQRRSSDARRRDDDDGTLTSLLASQSIDTPVRSHSSSCTPSYSHSSSSHSSSSSSHSHSSSHDSGSSSSSSDSGGSSSCD